MNSLDKLAAVMPLIVIIFSLTLYIITQKEIFLTFTVLSILLGLFLNIIEKDIIKYLFSNNPIIYRPGSHTPGFPSGHAQFIGFTLAFWTLYLIKEKNPNTFTISSLFLGISLFVVYSRVHIGCHTKIQVFAGFIVGLILGYISINNIKD